VTYIINPHRFGVVVQPHRYARMIPLVPGNYDVTASNEWGLAEIQLSNTPGGTNLIPDTTATASYAISVRTNAARDLLEGRALEFGPNEMMDSHWQVDAGSTMLPRHARHTARAGGLSPQAPLVFAWCYSFDAVNWFSRGIIDDSGAGAYSSSQMREYALASQAALNVRSLARMWAVNCTAGNGTPPEYLIFGEVAFATSPGGATVTSGGLPLGQGQRAGSRATFAFDGNNTTSAGARTNRYFGRAIGYYWPTPQPNIVECRLTAHTGDFGFMPSAGTIEWSSDGLNWNVAGSFSGQTGWTAGQTRSFAVSA
jgi:hypothetical protein